MNRPGSSSSLILHPSSFREEGVIEVSAPAVGEAATQLPWLFPCASSLAALARSAAACAWEQICLEPGAIVLLLRQTVPANPSSLSHLLLNPKVLDGALHVLDENSAVGFVDWSHSESQIVYRTALDYARVARALAQQTQR